MKIFQKLVYIVVLLATTTIGIATVLCVRSVYSLTTSLLQPTNTTSPVIPTQELPKTATTEPVVVGLEPEEANDDTDNDAVNYSGDYYLQSDGVPKPFADLDYLELTNYEYKEIDGENVGRAIAPKGMLRTTTPLKFSRIGIGGREISFQTETVDGVSYKFTGSFRDDRPENYCEIDVPQPDLKGKLIKIKDGKWAAEMNAEFYVACGC